MGEEAGQSRCLYGPRARAFIILQLVSAFFIDIANAVAIGFMVR